MILVLIVTLLCGVVGVAAAQEPPPAIDLDVKVALLEKQLSIERRANQLVANKFSVEQQMKKLLAAWETEAAEIDRLREEVAAERSKLQKDHDGWVLNENLQWQRQPEEEKGGGGG